MPKVSVLMVSFNQKDFIDEAINSVLSQSLSDLELMIYDNNSSDGTAERALKYKDPRVRSIIAKKNIGPVAARLECLDRSRGKYIAILDADDVFMPGKLAKQVEYLDNDPGVGAAFSLAEIIDDHGDPFTDKDHFYSKIFRQENRTRHQWLRRFFFDGNCLCHSSAVMRKNNYLGLPEPRLSQLSDFNCWIRTCFRRDIHIIQEPLVKYRVRAKEANASGIRPDTTNRTRFEFAKILKNYLGISAKDVLIKIFPEALNVIEEKCLTDPNLIKYTIARLALKANEPHHRIFAVETLYDLLGDKKTADKIKEAADFTYTDLAKLTGRSEISAHDIAIRDKDVHIRNLEAIIKNNNL